MNIHQNRLIYTHLGHNLVTLNQPAIERAFLRLPANFHDGFVVRQDLSLDSDGRARHIVLRVKPDRPGKLAIVTACCRAPTEP